MEEIENILLAHFKKYPLMEVVDAVKLIYQNEFGGGHLIADKEKAINFLKDEYSKVKDDSQKVIIEDIGNGYYRYYLYKLDVDIDTLANIFISSNLSTNGTLLSFKNKIEILKRLAKENKTPFAYESLLTYLKEYEANNYSMVSHSLKYKKAYNPAYRVIKKEF